MWLLYPELYSSGFPNAVLRPAASISSEILSQMQIQLASSKICWIKNSEKLELSDLCHSKPSRWFWSPLKFENNYTTETAISKNTSKLHQARAYEHFPVFVFLDLDLFVLDLTLWSLLQWESSFVLHTPVSGYKAEISILLETVGKKPLSLSPLIIS